jgi:hypothetical protein
MAAALKRSPKSRSAALRKREARSAPPVKRTTQKLPSKTAQKSAGVRRVGQTDPVIAAQFEAIARGLKQIDDIRVALAEFRTIVEALPQIVAAQVADRLAKDADNGQSPPAETDKTVIAETYEVAVDGPEMP